MQYARVRGLAEFLKDRGIPIEGDDLSELCFRMDNDESPIVINRWKFTINHNWDMEDPNHYGGYDVERVYATT